MLGLAVLLATLAAPPQPPDRARAEQLLRDGRPAEAVGILTQVLAAQPEDVDARVVLGRALTRLGEWQQAIDVLTATEKDAGENADLFGALAVAWRRAGDDRRALDYYARATALAPADPELRDGYETVARAFGHGVAFDGFGQHLAPGSTVQSGTLTARLRVAPTLFALGLARLQTGDGYTDTQYGAAVDWRAGRATTISLRAVGGSHNTALANLDLAAGATYYAGAVEIGGSVRELSFAGAGATTLSPIVAWDEGGRLRLDGRYTWSYSRFDGTAQTHADNSGMLRGTLRARRRVWMTGTYAYGIESFEDLTADRIGSLGAHTAAGSVRVLLRSLTTIDATWEHQWRSNASRLDRVTISVAQIFP